MQENEPETTTPEVSNVADNGVVVVSNIDVDDDVNDELSKDRIDVGVSFFLWCNGGWHKDRI